MTRKILRCQVVRNHSGDEGKAKRGDVYVVEGEPQHGLVKITRTRFNALFRNGLVIPLGEDGVAAPGKSETPPRKRTNPPAPRKMEPGRKTKVEPDPQNKSGATKAAAGTDTRKGSGPSKTQPGQKGKGPHGSQSGKKEQRASASAGDTPPGESAATKDAEAESTMKKSGKRGKRRGSESSPSTTPGSSPHGGTASIPATSDGGSNTKKTADDSAGLG